MLVDLSKKEIELIMSSLMNDDTTHTQSCIISFQI